MTCRVEGLDGSGSGDHPVYGLRLRGEYTAGPRLEATMPSLLRESSRCPPGDGYPGSPGLSTCTDSASASIRGQSHNCGMYSRSAHFRAWSA